jgi:dCMP deaminase
MNEDNSNNSNTSNDKWDNYFLNLALMTSKMSKDPVTKVGSSIKGPDKSVLSVGYNGFPANIPDDPEMLANRETKYKYIIHAEENAIKFALRCGFIPKGSTIYTTLPPCYNCYQLIRANGIKKIVTIEPMPEVKERWKEQWDLVAKQAVEDNCSITYVSRRHSDYK